MRKLLFIGLALAAVTAAAGTDAVARPKPHPAAKCKDGTFYYGRDKHAACHGMHHGVAHWY